MQYYGTALNEKTHYLWKLGRSTLFISRIRIFSLPFNPEVLPYPENGETLSNGDVRFYQFAGFSIMAIEGSCEDPRPGSKSVFFVQELIDEQQMKKRILAYPIAAKIIATMPFEVKW